MSKHTQGPWSWYGVELLSPNHFVLCCAKTGRPDPADARLIAAAPTMHEYIAQRAEVGDNEAKKILESINAGR